MSLLGSRTGIVTLGVLLTLVGGVTAQTDAIAFTSDRWTLVDAEVVTRHDRECLSGAAFLSDVEFQDGVIEVDIAVDGSRSYPGIVFRLQSAENYERVYVRPHRAGLYPDAIQYMPVINRVENWQLYNGDGYTAAAEIAANQWITMRLEIKGTQARVYLGNRPGPTLTIHDLKHGVSTGSVGVLGPKNESACFSNFRYRVDYGLSFGAPPRVTTPTGALLDWEISRSYPATRVNRDAYPGFYAIYGAAWQPAAPDPSGLVNIARYLGRSRQTPDLVLARTLARASERQDVKLSFGYSDEIDLFLNGRKVFSGNSAYRYRDPSFLGVVGPFDAVHMTLERGLNEIFLMVTEDFGGWGFLAIADRELERPIEDHSRMELVWETPPEFLTAESVIYDHEREILYVTNFDAQFGQTAELTGYISRVSLDGKILEPRWVSDLNAPTGISLRQDRLYVAERSKLAEIDVSTGTLLNRYAIPGADFPNDVAIDAAGNVYISDTSPSSHADSRIYRFRDGAMEVWLDGEEISRANALFVHGDQLLVGNSGDGMLKSVDLASKRIEKVVCLGAGVIDGIRVDSEGNYIVSQWQGRVYLISPEGHVIEVLDTGLEQINSADFEYIPERDLILIPTFLDNRVIAYRLNTGDNQ
jgi:sugar lactone lactonase YvrE